MIDFLVDGNDKVDFILKSEQLETDFSVVQDYLQLYIPIPDISSTFNHYEYRNYYSKRGADIVYKIHERDCDTFKYIY
jgi:hypothetical protein